MKKPTNALWYFRQCLENRWGFLVILWHVCHFYVETYDFHTHTYTRSAQASAPIVDTEKFNIKSLKIEAFFMSMDLYFIAKKLISTSNLLSQYNSWVIAYTLAHIMAAEKGNRTR